MSEAEKKRRLDYRRNRKKWIMIQIIAICSAAVLALGSFLAFSLLNKTYYIHYTEEANVDYKVALVENNFYEDEWLEKDNAYISDLVDSILATFTYKMNMEESRAVFDYNYTIDAVLKITDNKSGKDLYSHTDRLVERSHEADKSKKELFFSEQLNINFKEYNDFANEFMEAYNPPATSNLAVTMTVNVVSKSPDFEENGNNSYFITMNIPLAEHVTDINFSSSVTSGENKVIACSHTLINPIIFKVFGILLTVLVILAIGVLIAFIYLTRNEDINYSIKIKRILTSYRSFIQKINNEFDSEGYQILIVNTFNEMLGIRDTIQSPILMNENEDKTRTLFFIPTNTKILYIHEIKVDNYDDLYREEPEVEEEPIVEDPIIIAEDVNVEDIEEAMAAPDIELEDVDFVEDNDPEEEEGIEVIGVVWPERAHRNKVYKYDPNGEQLSDGDIVLVPSRDAAKNRDVIRKAAVAHGNHKVPPEMIHHPLKKIIGVVKHKAEEMLSSDKKEKDETDN